jgi:hypothetical protein
MAAPNPKRQREARERLSRIFANPDSMVVIHYSCQSFVQPQQSGSPRIASIALRHLGNGATVSFSVHQELELHSTTRDLNIDMLERAMLEKFFQYLAENRGMTFLHWNMRDIKFGFAALEHRYMFLGGTPYMLPDDRKIDLSMLTMSIYGSNCLPPPHLENLARKNGLSLAGYIDGREEPTVFSQGEFFAVLQSTLCKVSLIANAALLAFDGTLKTRANWWTLNVGRIREACEMFNNNPVQAWAGVLIAAVAASFSLFLKLL